MTAILVTKNSVDKIKGLAEVPWSSRLQLDPSTKESFQQRQLFLRDK